MVLNYDSASRLQFARERAERLEMRRGRRLTPEMAGFPTRTGLDRLLRRASLRLARAKQAQSPVPATTPR
jgi:hypothetical protein